MLTRYTDKAKEARGDAQFDADGCSCTTLIKLEEAGGDAQCDVDVCSHAKLNDLTGAGGDVLTDAFGCSRTTLKIKERGGGDDHTDVPECSPTTLRRCLGENRLDCLNGAGCLNEVLCMTIWIRLLDTHLSNMLVVWWVLDMIETTGNWVVYGATRGGGTWEAQSTQTDLSLLESSHVERDNDNAMNEGFEQGASRRESSNFGRNLVMEGLEQMSQDDGSSSEQD